MAIEQTVWGDLDLGEWPSVWAHAAETTVMYPWYVVVATVDSYGWHTPWTGVSDDRERAVEAMGVALRRCGPGAMGVVKRALHHLYGSAYTYRHTVCTATVDPTSGRIVVENGRP